MPQKTLFHSGTICVGANPFRGWLLVQGQRITRFGRGEPPAMLQAEPIDLQGRILAPGLIDTHVHGALGHDTMDATPEALLQMARFYARHGVTSFLATTVTASPERILAALRNVGQIMRQDTKGAALLGAHVEGPFLDRDKRGAQDAGHIRPAMPKEYHAWFETGIVKLITLAPEYPQNRDLIPYAVGQGTVVSIGHTRASYEDVCRAVELGATQVTHTFNGMEPLHHRKPGAIGAALTLDQLRCELIADGVHVHPAVLKLVVRAKGTSRILLITDAMRGTGMPDGQYTLGGVDVTVKEGIARTREGALAGSTLTLNRALANIMAAADLSLSQALALASRNPAQALGLERTKGCIDVGKDADLIVLDTDLNVCLTMVRGKIVYCA